MMRRWEHLLLLTGLLVCGCESGDPVNLQGGPGQEHRAVMNPWTTSSANEEVFSRNSGAMPLLTVDFGDRNSPDKVHSVVDDIATITGGAPATQPATKPAAAAPATEPAAANGNIEAIRVAAQQKADDKITFTRDNEGNVDLWVTTASGIGTVTLQRVGENWPPVIRIHFFYGPDKPFTRLEGLEASEISGERRVPLKVTSDKAAGKGQIAVPVFSRAAQIQIQWVDMYR
jgi:hypothetical protein